MYDHPMILVPAYGRTYDTSAKAEAAWNAGVDFKVYGLGCYTSKRDLAELKAGASSITIVCPTTRVEYRVA